MIWILGSIIIIFAIIFGITEHVDNEKAREVSKQLQEDKDNPYFNDEEKMSVEDLKNLETYKLLRKINDHLTSIERTTNTIHNIIIISAVIAVVCLFFDLFFGWM